MNENEKLQILKQIQDIFITGKGAPESANDPIFVALQKMISESENKLIEEFYK